MKKLKPKELPFAKVDPTEQKKYNAMAKKSMKADRDAELIKDAERFRSDILPEWNRQREAFYWVHKLGLPQAVAGKMMGISQQAVNKLLTKFFTEAGLVRPTRRELAGGGGDGGLYSEPGFVGI